MIRHATTVLPVITSPPPSSGKASRQGSIASWAFSGQEAHQPLTTADNGEVLHIACSVQWRFAGGGKTAHFSGMLICAAQYMGSTSSTILSLS